MKLIPILAALVPVLASCGGPGGGIPEVTPSMVSSMEVSRASLERGRATYIANCNRCHDRVLPGNLDPEYWRGIIPHMAKNAELSETEQSELLLYMMGAHNAATGVVTPD